MLKIGKLDNDLLKKIGVTNGVTASLKSVTLFYKSLFYLAIAFQP